MIHYLIDFRGFLLMLLVLLPGCGMDKQTEAQRQAAREELARRHIHDNVCRYAKQGQGEIVELLLQAGTSPNEDCGYGDSLLIKAAYGGDMRTIEALIKAGANVRYTSDRGVTPLEAASFNGNADAVRRLLQAGADPNAPGRPIGEAGAGPVLLAAVANDGTLVMRDLRAQGKLGEREFIDVWKLPNYEQLRQKYVAARTQVVKDLIAAGARVDVVDPRVGDTPLMEAAMWGLVDIVDILVDHGADVNKTRPDGTGALELAAIRGFNSVIERLIKA